MRFSPWRRILVHQTILGGRPEGEGQPPISGAAWDFVIPEE